MFIGLCCSPKPHVLLIHMSTQVEMCLITEQKDIQKFRIVLNPFANFLAKFIMLILVGLGLSLKNLYFVRKQFQVPMNDSSNRSPWNPHFLRSRLVDFRGDCSKWALTSWTWARVVAVEGGSLWPLLLFVTLPLSLNFSTRFLMVLQCGIFLPGNSSRNCLWTRTVDFVAKYTSMILIRSWSENCFAISILPSEKMYSYTLPLSWIWKQNINIHWIYKTLKLHSFLWPTLYIGTRMSISTWQENMRLIFCVSLQSLCIATFMRIELVF